MEKHSKLVMFAFSGHFLRGCLTAMTAGITEELFMPYRRTTLIGWALMISQMISIGYSGKELFEEAGLLMLIITLSWSSLFHQIHYTLNDFCRILDINIFSIKHPKPVEQTK